MLAAKEAKVLHLTKHLQHAQLPCSAMTVLPTLRSIATALLLVCK